MHKISIIIPVYNVEQYLPQCLDSVINQTYTNLEIILVNDGSTDSCPQICEDYAVSDKRIKVIHKKNGGLSDARNAGLKTATGEYISFVDSDDVLSPDFCELLLNALTANHADIAECGYRTFESAVDLEKSAISSASKTEIFETQKAMELLIKEDLKQMVWNKIYRKEVLLNIRFPVGKINEDEFWTYKVFGDARKIVRIPDVLYFYRQQTGSIMGKSYSVKRLDGLQALEERISYMKANFPLLEDLAVKNFCFGATYHYEELMLQPDLDPDGLLRKNIINRVRKFNKNRFLKKWHPFEVIRFKFFIGAPEWYLQFMKHYLGWRLQGMPQNEEKNIL